MAQPVARILVLDSGVGGLSVCRQLARRVPGAELRYVADNAAFPYGIRPDHQVRERVTALARDLCEREHPQLLVLACNTASTLALDAVRAAVPVPVVGVVPAIKPTAVRSRTRAIGLLGTPATVARAYTDDLIQRFAPDCRVVRLGSAEMAAWAEAKLRGWPVGQTALARHIAPLFDTGEGPPVDSVVLACTHFPWLKPELRRASPWRVAWIDSGRAIANRVAALLPAATVAAGGRDHRILFTRPGADVEALRPALARAGFSRIAVAEPATGSPLVN